MNKHIFYRRQIRISNIPLRDPALAKAIEQLEHQLDRARNLGVWKLLNEQPSLIAQEWGSRLAHPLSNIWLSRRPTNPWGKPRPESETELCRRLLMPLRQPPSLDQFITDSKRFASCFLKLPTVDFRRSPIRVESDSDGTTVEFAPAEEIYRRMADLFHDLSNSQLGNAMTAIFVLVAFLNIHPFHDSNGRCARMWLNFVLNKNHGNHMIIPLRQIAEVSRGGFELRMRDAELNGQWTCLVNYFVEVHSIAEQTAKQVIKLQHGAR